MWMRRYTCGMPGALALFQLVGTPLSTVFIVVVMAKSAGSSFEQILSYLYQPEVDSDELETLSGEDDSALEAEHLEEPNQGRLGNTDWCSCGHCNGMSAVKEGLCCQEMIDLRHKLEQEQQTLDCITENSAFYRVVLEHEVLSAALVANIDRLREPLEEPLPTSYD